MKNEITIYLSTNTIDVANSKPCYRCGTTDIKKKIPQEYKDGEPIWEESCYDCWQGNPDR